MTSGKNWIEEPVGGSWEQEEKIFTSLANEIQEIIELQKSQNNGHRRRGNHAKMLAATKNAKLIIAPDKDLAGDLRYGFLATPSREYNALVRFSNATSVIRKDDSIQDLRGIAFRITADHGDQDFLLTNAEPNHARDAIQTIAITMALTKEKLTSSLLYLIKRLGLFETVRMLLTVRRQANRPVESLGTESYWSRSAFAVGENANDPQNSVAVKLQLIPVVKKSTRPIRANDLGAELEARLSQEPVRYYLQAQRYIDPQLTSIEDSSKAWKSNYETIAELILPKQELSDADNDFFENLEFTPWHTDLNHFKPLGNSNRARRFIYPASAKHRKS